MSDRPLEPRLVSAYDWFAQCRERAADPSRGRPFDPAESPLHGRAIFCVGAPRSGTTWLQQLLLLHPATTGAAELHVFCEGVGALYDNYEHPVAPGAGLGCWITRPELTAMTRRLVDDVFTTMRDAMRPDATHVLDKTPNHVPYAARLAEVYPDAAFVHIVRDGRDSVSSALDLWSWSDAYSSPRRVAEAWRDSIEDCRTHLGPLRYYEVRYEDLLADTEKELARIYDHLGLPYDEDFLRTSVEFGRTPLNLRPSRSDVGARKWGDLPPDVEREIYLGAGSLLAELGYVAPDRVRDVVSHRTARRAAYDAAQRARAGGAKFGRRLGELRRSRDPEQRRRAEVRRLADTVVAAMRDPDRIGALLRPDVALTEGGRTTEGAAAVAARLAEIGSSGQAVQIEADEGAAALRWSGSAEGVTLVRLTVDGGRVRSVDVR